MIELKVFHNLEDAIEFCRVMGDRLDPEIAKAMNRAAKGIRTDVTKQIATTRDIKRSEMKDWSFRNASAANLEASATIKGARLGLEKFAPRPKRVMDGRTSGGVQVTIFGKQVQLRHGFMHSFRSGDLQVLQRKKGAQPKNDFDSQGRRLKGRFPVYHPTAVAVPQMADDDDVVDKATEGYGERYLKQFDHLVDRLIQEYK